jgi:ParB family chromosome partitioning protein
MGTGYGRSLASKGQPATSTRSLVRAYQEEVRRQEVLIRKAEIGEQRLLLLTTALRQLLAEEHFRTLLRAEGLDDLPKVVANQIKSAP